MLSKKLTPLVVSCASFFLFTQNHILFAQTSSNSTYDGVALAQDLQNSTGLITTVSNRDELSDAGDRVNADQISAQNLLTTDTLGASPSTADYYTTISAFSRTPAFTQQNLTESINPIVSGTFQTSRPLTSSEIASLATTAAQVERDGTTVRIIHGTRKTVRLLSQLDPHSHVVQAHTHCTPAPPPQEHNDSKERGYGNRYKS